MNSHFKTYREVQDGTVRIRWRTVRQETTALLEPNTIRDWPQNVLLARKQRMVLRKPTFECPARKGVFPSFNFPRDAIRDNSFDAGRPTMPH